MRKREREYTPEEAYALTMRESAPHWYGANPLLVGVDLHDRVYPQPLDPILHAGTWVFFFVSPTGAEFPRVREIFSAWLKRFRPLGVNFIFSFRGHYSFFNERRAVEKWVASLGFGTPAVCDASGSLLRSFGLTGDPAVAILSEGEVVCADEGPRWAETAESHLHEILRESSPGLSLWPVVRDRGEPIRTTDRWPLRDGAKAILEKRVVLFGSWEIEADRITTGDSKAELHFTAPASTVTIVARSLSDAGDPTRIRFDFEGASYSDVFAGGDFAVDDEGNSGLVVAGPRGYSALRALTPAFRKVRFRFPFAKINRVAVYGFEFGDPDAATVEGGA